MTTFQQDQMHDLLRRARVIPVLAIERAEDAPTIVQALVDGGLPMTEITLRTAAGLDALRAVRDREGVCGAGTVTTADEARAVIDAGAQFVVSPGLDVAMVRTCQEAGVAVFPGVATPSEVMAARALGLRAVKVFPAGPLGGPAFIRSLASLWSDMTYLPTGGVSAANAPEYLALPSVVAVGGTWIATGDMMRERDWAGITRRAAEAVALASVTT